MFPLNRQWNVSHRKDVQFYIQVKLVVQRQPKGSEEGKIQDFDRPISVNVPTLRNDTFVHIEPIEQVLGTFFFT